MTMCAIGGRPVVGRVRRVKTTTHPDGVDTCEGHGLAYEFGDGVADALAKLLGDDHPFVEKAHAALDDLLSDPCPVSAPEPRLPSAWVEPPPLPIDDDTRRRLDELFPRCIGG